MKREDFNLFNQLPREQLLAILLIGEGSIESYEGRLAIASTVLNRVDYGIMHKQWGKLYGNDVHSVILAPKQYSCFNEDDRNFKRLKDIAKDYRAHLVMYPSVRSSDDIAVRMLNGTQPRVTTALHYERIEVDSKWDDDMVVVKKTNHHKFLAMKGKGGEKA